MKVKSILRITMLTVLCLYITGCSGEPSYPKPTAQGTKNVKENFGKGEAKGAAPVGKF
jgi:PBP1b-binding outer membrane lipoprotein LpoB